MKKFVLSMVTLASLAFADGNITYKIDGKDYEAYYVNATKNAPLVFMVHDWDGITDYEIK